MAANRQTPTSGSPTGQQYADDVAEEIAALWDQVTTKLGSVAGTNTITATATPTLLNYADGQRFSFIAANANTGAVTINIDTVGAKAVVSRNGAALTTGDILAGTLYEIQYDSGGGEFRLLEAPAGVPAQVEVAVIRYHLSDGSNGGNVAAGGYETYPLTAIVSNGITGLTLGANRVTLPPGEYEVDGFGIFHRANEVKLRLYNVTAGAFVSTIVSPQIYNASSLTVPASFSGTMTLGATSSVEMQYYAAAARATDGLGWDHPEAGVDEEYGYIRFRRISPFSADLTRVDRVGVGTDADATVRLRTRSEETEFNAMPVADGGTGDILHRFLTQNGGGVRVVVIEEDVTLTGAFKDGIKVIPTGAIVLGFSMRLTTAASGATSITAGTTQDTNEFGTGIAIGLGTTSKRMLNDGLRTLNAVVRFTAVGGNFTGGVARYAVAYLEMIEPAA